MGTVEVLLRCADSCADSCIRVQECLALEIPLIRDRVIERKNAGFETIKRRMKGITGLHLSWVLNFLVSRLQPRHDPDYYSKDQIADFDLVFLFNLIQAAHYLQIKSLMDLTCEALATKVRALNHENLWYFLDYKYHIGRGVKAAKRDVLMSPGSSATCGSLHVRRILRSRQKETFIDDSDFVDRNLSSFVATELFSLETWTERLKSIFGVCVGGINKFTNFEELVKVIHQLERWMNEDFRSGLCLSASVASTLVKILESSRYSACHHNDIQRPIVKILMRARFDTCGDVMENEVVPVLVKTVSDGNIAVSKMALLALMHFAYNFPHHYKFIVDKGALDAALRVFRDARDKHGRRCLAMFLVAVCRGYSRTLCSDDLPCDKVKDILTILEDLLTDEPYSHDYTRKVDTRTVACYALQYLSFGMCVELQGVTLDRLIALFSNANTSLAGAALGVVGNVVRWGNLDQIQALTSDYELVQNLWSVLRSKYKKFQMEACRIISNIAVRRGPTKDMFETGLIVLLSYLLEKEESDVKLEAAWAILNSFCGCTKHGEIDHYDELAIYTKQKPNDERCAASL